MPSRGKTGKLDSSTEMCLFIGYHKGMRGGIFYNLRDKKVFLLKHDTFLKHEYINDFKSRSKLLIEEIYEKTTADDSTKVVENGTDFVTTSVVDL